MKFKRNCERCGKLFQPRTKFSRICNKCNQSPLFKKKKLLFETKRHRTIIHTIKHSKPTTREDNEEKVIYKLNTIFGNI